MKNDMCPQEEAVAAALKEGRLSPHQENHAAGCASCRELVEVSRWMKSLSGELVVTRELPEAGFIWLKARVFRRDELRDRALEPISIVHKAAFAVISFCWITLVGWDFQALKAWVAEFDAPDLLMLLAGGGSSQSLTLLWVFIGLLCITATLTMHSVLAEE